MVQYYLSGAVMARVDGTPAALGGPKQRCVLAVLLANHGSVVSVDRLIDAVWGDEPPPKALASVRSYMANLRRVLDQAPDAGHNPSHTDGQRLASHPHGYQLNLLTGDSVDLFHFEDLVAAGRNALIRGDAATAVAMLGEALGHGAVNPSASSRITSSPHPRAFGSRRYGRPVSRRGSTLPCNSVAALSWFPRSRPRWPNTHFRNACGAT